MSGALRVLHGGVLATVQDRGRHGCQRVGVPRSGAMDVFALAAANRLVGNPPDSAVLELTAGGASFVVESPALLAFTGADLGARVDGEQLPLWTAVYVRAGTHVQLTGRTATWGARAYLAVSGGISLPPVLGSCSTYLPGGFGGYQGRALLSGDVLDFGAPTHDPLRIAGRSWPVAHRPAYSAEPTLRLIPGPHLDYFTPIALETMISHPFTVDARSNRMGYRLMGPSLSHVAPVSLPSLPVMPGVVQVPPDGAPILLMADAQTTGGYPIIGVVIEPDISLAAQLLPGDMLRFAAVSREEAIEVRRQTHGCLTIPFADDESLAALDWAGS